MILRNRLQRSQLLQRLLSRHHQAVTTRALAVRLQVALLQRTALVTPQILQMERLEVRRSDVDQTHLKVCNVVRERALGALPFGWVVTAPPVDV